MLIRPVVLSQYLLNNRSRPEVRDVIADAYEEHGSYWAKTMSHISGSECGGYGDGGDGGGGDGQKITISQEKNLKPGVKIVVLGGGTYSYVLVGLLRQVDGDEWEIAGARCIRRFGSNAALADLAATGPKGDTKLLEESKQPEEIHRLLVRRAIPCDEAAWAKHLPIAMAAR